MILSHSRSFIALKTRKTGGTSFEIALSKYMSPQDVVTPIAPDDEAIRASLGYRGPQNHLIGAALGPGGQQKQEFRNHMEAQEVRALVPPEIFDGYLKVAIVRNPYDYVVSWYFWERSRVAVTSREDFREWLKFQYLNRPKFEAAYRQRRNPNPGVFASNHFITHIDGKSAVDLMMRYEFLEEDMALFARRVGLPSTLYNEFRGIRAKGSYRPALATSQVMFEGFTEGLDIVSKMFAEEIATYHYALPEIGA